ncbi:MAG: hypothetical protein ACXWXR_03235 [Candidatus Limnocylindrales bacterium]
MGITARDRVATVLVGAAVVLAIGWFADLAGLRTFDVVSITLAVLVLGVPASAAAVVPGFEGLIRGSRSYLLISSALGLAAAAAALLTIANRTEETLAVLVGLTVVLWAGATWRHGGVPANRWIAIRSLTPCGGGGRHRRHVPP